MNRRDFAFDKKLSIIKGKDLPEKKFKDITLTDILFSAAQHDEERGLYFVKSDGDEEFFSYLELLRVAKSILLGFNKLGIKPNDKVILEIKDEKDFFCAFWAGILGGIITAPISTPSSYNVESPEFKKLLNVWEILEKPFIITEDSRIKKYDNLKNEGYYTDLKVVSLDKLRKEDQAKSIYQSSSEDIAYLQFSSGSTGNPKGVKLTHRNIISNIMAICNTCNLNNSDISISWLPHTHDMGLIGIHLSSVFKSINQVKMTPQVFLKNPSIYLEKIKSHKCTISSMPNFGLSWILNKVKDKELRNVDLSSMRVLINGAEPISINIMNDFISKYKNYGFKPEAMCPAYGMAEASLAISFTPLSEEANIFKIDKEDFVKKGVVNDNIDGTNQLVIVDEGYPIHGVDIRVVDNEDNIVEENIVGHIQVRGPNVTQGYINNEEANSDLFCCGWLRTGDMGFIRNGRIAVTGRKKEIIFVNGINYYANDIEEVIYELEEVQRGDLGVIGVYNYDLEAEEILVFIKYRGKTKDFLNIRKPIIKKANEHFGLAIKHIIPVSKIPKTTSGKIQRFKLREEYLQNEYSDVINEINKELESYISHREDIENPSTSMENEIRRIWADVLGINENNISINDNFNEIGGNSIKATQILLGLEKMLNKSLSHDILIDKNTIREIASHIEELELDNYDLVEEVIVNVEKRADKYSNQNRDIAVIGVAVRFPGSKNTDDFWKHLEKGDNLIRKMCEDRKNLSGYKEWDDYLGYIDDVDGFDAGFFNISEEEARYMDPQQRLILQVVHETLEDGNLLDKISNKENVGVYIGASQVSYNELVLDFLKHNSNWDKAHPSTMVGNLLNMVSARVSHTFGFTGPAMTVDTACSSSLAALYNAVQSLRNSEIEGAIVAGTQLILTPSIHILSDKAGILSGQNKCQVFGEESEGTLLGEGIGAVYLEPLEKAIENRRNIYGVIKGIGIDNDGASLGIMAPNPDGQLRVLVKAYNDAKITPDKVSYIEAHGTGTPLGDPIELKALNQLFSRYFEENNQFDKCYIGSVKSNIGHLLGAAGIAGLIKTLLCLKYRKLVPSINIEKKNMIFSEKNFAFDVITETEEWKVSENNKRIAGVSSFGFGGTNVHVVLEEPPLSTFASSYKIKDERNGSLSTKCNLLKLLPISGKSSGAVYDLIKQYSDYFHNNEMFYKNTLSDICCNVSLQKKHYDHRICLVAKNHDEIKEQMTEFLSKDKQYFCEEFADIIHGKMAFIFTGQGNQWFPMGRQLYSEYEVFRNTIEKCDLVFKDYFDWSLIDIIDKEEYYDKLTDTEFVQPFIFALQIALAELLKSWGIIPQGVIGHSLGEIAAAHFAGILNLEDSIKVIFNRSRLMQKSKGTGKMALISVTETEVKELIDKFDGNINIAAINDPSSVLVSGDSDSIIELMNEIQDDDMFYQYISHDFAFHSHKMKPYKEELISKLSDIQPVNTIIPIYSTVTGKRIEGRELDSSYWGIQLCNRVNFEAAVNNMIDDSYSYFFELGPHNELSPSIFKILAQSKQKGVSVTCMKRNQDETLVIHNSLKKLYEKGYDIDWSKFYSQESPVIQLPLYPWQEKKYWINVDNSYEHFSNKENKFEKENIEDFLQNNALESNKSEYSELVRLSLDERKKKIEKYIAEKIGNKLNKTTENIDVNMSIISMGLDSLNAIELKNAIENKFNTSISIVDLMSGPSIAELALLLSKQFGNMIDIDCESKVIENNEYPLSYGQRALWSIHTMFDDNVAYNINFGFSVYSDLNIPHLEKCIHEIIQRHKSLRTVYIEDNRTTIQRVIENIDFKLQIEYALKWKEEFLNQEIKEFTHQAFDLKNGPLFRIKLYKIASKHYIIIFSFHHIAVDLWSLELIVNDLIELYNSEQANKNCLPEINTSYFDFVEYQNQRSISADWKRMQEYWHDELSGKLPYLNIPTDNPRPEIKTYNGSTYSFQFDSNTSKMLKENARNKGITLFSLLLGVYKLFLYNITGQKDILVGTPSLGRSKSEFEKIVGYFINPIVIRSDFSEELTFERFFENLNKKVINALDNQEYPFTLIVDKINPERKANQNPIFQTMFVLEKASHLSQLSNFILGQDKKIVSVGKLDIEPYYIAKEASQFDITLIVAEENNTISASFEYNTDLFDKETIESFAEQLKILAENVINNSQCKIKDVRLLNQNIHDLNYTEVDYPINQCISKMVEKCSVSNPLSVAVTDKNQSITYKELNERANILACYLKEQGVEKDVIVGIRLEPSVELIICMLAILKAGGAYMAIDVNYPTERVVYMLRDTKSPILIINDNDNLRIGEDIKIINFNEVYCDKVTTQDLNVDISPDNLVYVIYTSGSTGNPKGIMVEHHSLVNMIYAHRRLFEETNEDKISQLANISFDACAFEIWPALTIGAELRIGENDIRNDPDKLKTWLIQNKINIAFLPTPIGKVLISMDWSESTKLRSLRIAGDKLHEYVKTELPFKVYNLYGPTEATIWATSYEVPLSFSQQSPPIGKPIDNVRVYILDENMKPCSCGVKGEIYIGGNGITRGYINRPDLNSEVFLPDSFSDKINARLYKTGDLGYYLPDGNIAYVGRKDFQVKIRGYRIELQEIESIINQHPSIKHIAVTARENIKGIKQLIAYITFKEDEFTEEDILRNWLKGKVPEYMIPHIFVMLDNMPLSISGKIDKKKLPEPVLKFVEDDVEHISPKTHKEKILQEIWGDILGIQNIGIDDNFFNLGGDSILAIQIANKAKKYGLKISTNQLFNNQSIRKLAMTIREDKEELMIQSSPVSGEIPLTPIQHWFFEQKLNNPVHWNQGILLKANKFIDASLLQISALELAKQHDMEFRPIYLFDR